MRGWQKPRASEKMPRVTPEVLPTETAEGVSQCRLTGALKLVGQGPAIQKSSFTRVSREGLKHAIPGCLGH